MAALCLAAAAAQAGDRVHALDEAWSWLSRPGIEWVTAAGDDQDAPLLVLTRDGHLHVLELRTGNALCDSPPRVAPSARPAVGECSMQANMPSADVTPSRAQAPASSATTPETAYCFDRGAAYAVRLTRPAGLRWRFGSEPIEGGFPGDPEVLTGWIAARPVARGLLMVGSDGRLLLLDRETGDPLWQHKLGPLGIAELHTCGSAAVVLWKTHGHRRAAFVDMSTLPAKMTGREMEGDWPLWSTLVPEGLLLVSADGFTLWPAHGPPQQVPVTVPGIRAATTAVSVYRPASSGAAEGASTRGTVLLLGTERGLLCCALGDVNDQPRVVEDVCEGWMQSLAVRGDCCLIGGNRCAAAVDIATGRELGRIVAPGDAMLLRSCNVRGQELYALFEEPSASRMTLIRTRLDAQTDSRPALDHFSLDAHEQLRDVLWAGSHLVLVAPECLRAYKLP